MNFRTHLENILRILNPYSETFFEQEMVMLTLAAILFHTTATAKNMILNLVTLMA